MKIEINSLLINIGKVLSEFPEIDLSDALSRGQIESKLWLIDELSKITNDLDMTFILGGWYGFLPALMFASEKFNKLTIRSFDIDPNCVKIADALNKLQVINDWQFKAVEYDMYEINYFKARYTTVKSDGSTSKPLIETPQTIINTSCEHLEDFNKWWNLIPRNCLVVLQSNNFYEGDGHVNCVNNLDEFKQQLDLSQIDFSGELDLGKYKRFMIIGKK